MKPDRLENLLAGYAERPLPAASVPTAANVWREIERRRRQSIWTRLFPVLDWRELFSEPRMAMVALAFAVVVGVVPAALASRTVNERRLARQSIHFEVFAMDSSMLGSVLMKPMAATSGMNR